MKKQTKLTPTGQCAWWGISILNKIIVLILALVLGFSCYALYDTWRVLHGADNSKLLAYKPGGELGIEELVKINPEVCGWLTVDNTYIDYPVVKGEDNTKYLDLDATLEYSAGGSIFLDYRNSNTFTDDYSILYGHHMVGNAMFTDVLSFEDEEFFETHPYGSLTTVNDNIQYIEFFAYIDADGNDNVLYSPITSNAESKNRLISQVQNTALNYRELELTETDRYITLSTCTEAMSSKRGVLVGRLTDQKPESNIKTIKRNKVNEKIDWMKYLPTMASILLLLLVIYIIYRRITNKKSEEE